MQDLFLEIQGQKSALNLLSELHSKNRIPNALLFTGIEGCGKFRTAIQFLKLLNKSSPEIFPRIASLSEPYVKLIMPMPRGKSETNADSPISKLSQDTIDEINQQVKLKSENNYHRIDIKNANNIKINSIREINKIISINYDEIDFRGIILCDAHKMSIEAQNAFLKNLEEPPEGIVYILITDNPGYLLSTIRSRCWEIPFTPLKEDELHYILTENFHLPEEEIIRIIPFAQGSVTRAQFLYENNVREYLHKTIIILRYSLAKKYFTALKEFNELIAVNPEESYEIIIDLIITWFKDTLKQKWEIGKVDFKDYEETLQKFNSRFEEADINRIVERLVEYRNAINKNVNLNLLTLNVIFDIASIGMKRK